MSVCINPVPMRSQKSCCFHSSRTPLHCSWHSFMCTLQPSNRQRSNATHTQYDVLPSEKRCAPTQHTNFASDMTSVAAHSCSNSGASASEGREPRSLNLCRNLKLRFYSKTSSSMSSRVGSPLQLRSKSRLLRSTSHS